MMPSVRPAGLRIVLEPMSLSRTASDAARMHAPINVTNARDTRTALAVPWSRMTETRARTAASTK